MIRISDCHKIETTRTGSGRPQSAIAAGQQFCKPLYRFLSASHSHQSARDIADHMLQKGIGRNINDDKPALSEHPGIHYTTERAVGLTACRPECTEIVLAE